MVCATPTIHSAGNDNVMVSLPLPMDTSETEINYHFSGKPYPFC